MNIAILGAGNVGTTLGRRLLSAGHTVTYGVRDPVAADNEGLRASGAGVAGVAEAVAGAELALLTVPFGAVDDVLAAAGDFGGRVLVDATNPIGPGLTLRLGYDDSGAEYVQRAAPSARVVKAFNTTGVENMAQPAYGELRTAMFVCGDDANARAQVLSLAADIGFEPVDAGDLSQARLLEPTALLWIRLALVQGQGRGFAFGLLRR